MKVRAKYIRRKWFPPPFKNYARKFSFLLSEQSGKCAITGVYLVSIPGSKVDIMHILDRRKENIERFPLYTDCVWNLMLGYNDAHLVKAKPKTKKRPLHVIDRLERILAENPGIEYEMTAEEALEKYGGNA